MATSSSTPPPYYLRASVDNTPQPGQRVNVQVRGKQARTVHDCGIVRFRGKVHFAAGEWCGVELDRDQSWGRNDGSVEGVRYFVCEPRQGVFVRVQRCTAVKGDACCVTPPQLMDSSLRRNSTGMSVASSQSSASGLSPFDAILSFSPVSARSSAARSNADARFDALVAEYSSSGTLISNVDLEPWREKVGVTARSDTLLTSTLTAMRGGNLRQMIQCSDSLEQSMELFERLGRAIAAKSHAQHAQTQSQRISKDAS